VKANAFPMLNKKIIETNCGSRALIKAMALTKE
jgi:hypothetical protein